MSKGKHRNPMSEDEREIAVSPEAAAELDQLSVNAARISAGIVDAVMQSAQLGATMPTALQVGANKYAEAMGALQARSIDAAGAVGKSVAIGRWSYNSAKKALVRVG